MKDKERNGLKSKKNWKIGKSASFNKVPKKQKIFIMQGSFEESFCI